jgi:preprotein translocase subunit SecD
MKNLRWRVLATLVVVGLAIWAVYPPDQKIKLGLDLQGGVHLVLRVQTDDALRIDTETTLEQLREAAETKGVSGATFTATTPTQFKVEGVPQPQDAAFREAANEVSATFNRESGANGSYTFEMKPNIAVQLRESTVTQALQTIERRVNDLGVAEPVIARTGSNNDQIIVELPGVKEVARAKEIIRSTASSRSSKTARLAPRKRCCSRAAARCPPTWRSCQARAILLHRGIAPRRSSISCAGRPP